METIVNYKVIQADNIETLVTKVNESIIKGWSPLGGICEGGNNESYQFFQAIVQYM